jgi:hypothetical protein
LVPVFSFDFASTLASHQKGIVSMSFLCQLFERFLRVLAQHVINAFLMGIPCFLRGAADVAALSGYSFGL